MAVLVVGLVAGLAPTNGPRLLVVYWLGGPLQFGPGWAQWSLLALGGAPCSGGAAAGAAVAAAYHHPNRCVQKYHQQKHISTS